MKFLLLLLMLCSSAALAEPIRFEAQGGRCKQTIAPDGIWWSSYYPTNIDSTPTCYQIGLSQTPWSYRDYKVGWRVAHVNLGKVTAENQFTVLEPQQPGVSGENCNMQTWEGCRARGTLTQKTYGLSIGPLVERSWGDFTVGLEAGLYYYYSIFDVMVTPVPDPDSRPSVRYTWDSHRWTPYYGGTLRYGYLFFSGRVYSKIAAEEEYCSECQGITLWKAYQATIGLQVPF